MNTEKQKKIFLIINPNAGRNKGKRVVETVVPFFRENNCIVRFSYTERAGHATILASEAAAGGYDLVVAVGGDGTMNEVACGLTGTTIPMGIIPVGSGNGLARDLGISTGLRKCSRSLISGSDIRLDICRVNSQRFFCTSGIGFNARIAEMMATAGKRGFRKYVQLVIRESLSFKPFSVRLSIDGEMVEESVFMVTFANASQFGNDAFIAPGASMTDGLIDIVLVGSFNKIWFPLAASTLFSKQITRLPFVKCFRARHIVLESADNKAFYFDGEPGDLTLPAIITLDAEKIQVRVPG